MVKGPTKKKGTKSKEKLISSLHCFTKGEFDMRLKVISKSPVKTTKKNNAKYFGATFKDTSGALIKAAFFGPGAQMFDKIDNGKCYLFQEVHSRPVKPEYGTADTNCQLVFNQVSPVESIDVKQFKRKQPNITSLTKLKHPLTLDVKAFLLHVGEIDERGFLKLLLWQDAMIVQLTVFQKKVDAVLSDLGPGLSKREKGDQLEVIFTSVRTSEYKGGITLATTPTTEASYNVVTTIPSLKGSTFKSSVRLPLDINPLFRVKLDDGLQSTCFVTKALIGVINPENFAYLEGDLLKYAVKVEICSATEYLNATGFGEVGEVLLKKTAVESKKMQTDDPDKFITHCQNCSMVSALCAVEKTSKGWVLYDMKETEPLEDMIDILRNMLDRYPVDIFPKKITDQYDLEQDS